MQPMRFLLLVTLAGLALAACSGEKTAPPSIPGLEATLAVQTLTAQHGIGRPFQPSPTTAPAASRVEPTAAQPASLPLPPPESASPAQPTPLKINDQIRQDNLDCENAAEFVDDVNIPDNTRLKSKSSFIKTWRFKNIGSCTWTKDYQLVYVGGDPLGLVEMMLLGQEVPPGKTVDISIPFACPEADGSYKSNWMFRDPSGTYFGTGKEGQNAFWVSIEVAGGQYPNGGFCGGGG